MRCGALRLRVASVAMALGVVTVIGLAADSARAQQGALPRVPSRRIVEVHVAGAGSDAASLDDTMRELLGRLTLIMESQAALRIDPDDASFREAARPSMLARVGIDLRARDAAIITIVDGRTGAVSVRRSVSRDGPPAVLREEIAHVVQAAIDPLVILERDRANAAAVAEPPPPEPPPDAPSVQAAVPAAPPPAAPVAPTDAPPPRDAAANREGSRSPFALDLSTSAGAGAYASGVGIVPRAGGAAMLVYRRGVRPSIGVSAHYLFPFDTASDVVVAHVGVVAVRGVLGAQVFGRGALALDVMAGAGVDALRVEGRSNVLPSVRLGSATSRVGAVAVFGAVGYWAIGAGTSLSLMVGADVDPSSRRWVLESDAGSRSAAFVPSRIRPSALLGFTFTALGEARFAARETTR